MTRSDFWSRRKAAVEAEEAAEVKAQDEASQVEREEELAEKSDEEILKELGLPDPDELGKDDDFKAFLSGAVPERLRRRALRRLWRVNPVFAGLDGLVEYGEDYTDAATVMETLATSYEVGKGMIGRIREAVAEDDSDGNEAPPETETEPASDEGKHLPETELANNENAQALGSSTEMEPDSTDLERNFYTRPTRMRYRFES